MGKISLLVDYHPCNLFILTQLVQSISKLKVILPFRFSVASEAHRDSFLQTDLLTFVKSALHNPEGNLLTFWSYLNLTVEYLLSKNHSNFENKLKIFFIIEFLIHLLCKIILFSTILLSHSYQWGYQSCGVCRYLVWHIK